LALDQIEIEFRGLPVPVRGGNGEEHLDLPERHAISLVLLVQ